MREGAGRDNGENTRQHSGQLEDKGRTGQDVVGILFGKIKYTSKTPISSATIDKMPVIMTKLAFLA